MIEIAYALVMHNDITIFTHTHTHTHFLIVIFSYIIFYCILIKDKTFERDYMLRKDGHETSV